MGTKSKLPAETANPRRKWWRRVLSHLQSRAERYLHPNRRRRAQNRVRSLTGIRSVLFVCHGNIYRSPFAAECFRTTLASSGRRGIAVGSAGFVGPGRPAPPEAQLLAERFGVDLRQHQSRLVMGALLADYDLVVVMEAQQARELARRFGVTGTCLVLGDLDPELSDARTIVDPWRGSEQVLNLSYTRIQRCVSELTKLLSGNPEPALIDQAD